jgi:hypothetical protein
MLIPNKNRESSAEEVAGNAPRGQTGRNSMFPNGIGLKTSSIRYYGRTAIIIGKKQTQRKNKSQ